MGLPNVAIHRPVMTAMVFSALLILGLISLLRLPVELYQGQNQGIISVIVRARGGLSPEDVEKTITIPVEESVATVSRLKNLYSTSRESESRVTMEFETGTDMRFAALEVREKFSRVIPILPREIEKPVIANYDDAQAAVMVFALTSKTLSPEEIRDLVETELKPILTRVDGVASVEIFGGRERKILVEIDRDKMVAYNVPVEKVMDVLGQSNINLLAGNVDSGKLALAIRTMGAFQSVEEVGEIGIHATRQGSIIQLKEIATIKDSYLEAADHARLNLEQNVTVYIKKTSLANTIPVVKTARGVLNDFIGSKRGLLDVILVSDKADIIKKAIADVRDALLIGMFLSVGIIYLFLRNWLLAAIVFISIPCSVVTTFFLMSLLGISINVMTMSGLALAIGILVDSSVVILENVFKKKEEGHSDSHAIRTGSEEMWIPLLSSLATSLIVFLPIIFIDKKIQMIYSGFAFTVSASLICSFFTAQMLIPMLLRQWARGTLGSADVSKGKRTFFNKIETAYHSLIRWILDKTFLYRALLIALIFTATIVVGIILKNTPVDWPTTYQENEFSIIIFPLAGARLEANDDAVKRVEDMLSKIPDVEMFSSTVRKDDIRIFVRLKPKKKRSFAKDEVMKIIDEKGNEMIKQIHDDYSLLIDEGASSSEQKKLIIHIFGLENETLQKLAVEVANRVSKIPGYTNHVMTDLRKRPEYSVVVDKGRAALYGLSVKDVADSLHAQVRGMRPTKFHELTKGEEIETITRLQAIYRQKIDDIKLVPVVTDNGVQIPIGEIAGFYPSTGPQTIDRKDKYRYVFVKGDTKRPLEEVAGNVRKALKDLPLPDDYYWRFGGGYEELIRGRSQLSTALLLTVALVFMVLACMFQSYMQPLLIMTSVPAASIGIWIALKITKSSLSQQVFVGMILLAGYVVNAAIIMVDRMNHLKAEGKLNTKEVLISAGLDRLRPIAMTTASTVLGFMPMALSFGQASDLWAPLAVTMIGGLLSSTVLTLFILPTLLSLVYEFKEFIKPQTAAKF